MFDLFLNPSQLFNRLSARPGWVVPFLVVVVLTIAAACLTAPISQQLVMQHLPAGVDEARLERIQSSFTFSTYLGIVLTPIIVFVRIGIITVLFYAVMTVAGIEASYRHILSLLTWASVFTAVDRLGGAAMNYAAGAEQIHVDTDLQSTFLGANAFFTTASPILRSLADSLSPFSVWYLVLVTLGISVMGRVPRTRALFVTATVWCIQTGCLTLMAVVLWRSRVQ